MCGIKPQFFSKNKKRGERCNFAMGQTEKIVPIIMKRMKIKINNLENIQIHLSYENVYGTI